MSVMAPSRKKSGEPLTPERIKAIREALGLTQAEAAERVRVSQSVWSAWERGTRTPSRQSELLIRFLQQKKL